MRKWIRTVIACMATMRCSDENHLKFRLFSELAMKSNRALLVAVGIALICISLILLLRPREVESSASSDDDTCNSQYGHDRAKCVNDKECVWCVASAVPSACYTKDNAKNLPSAVFTCDSTDSTLSHKFDHEWEGGDYQSTKRYRSSENSKVEQDD